MRASEVEAVVRGGAALRVDAQAWARIRRAAAVARAQTSAVYGRTTGVGANKSVAVTTGQGLRLLRSHAGGTGALIPAEQSRAMMVVRVAQLGAGGSGVSPGLVEALISAVGRGLTPPVRRTGSIGTGDLTALAGLGLCLIGERPWIGGTQPAVPLDDGDALPLISSSAATLGAAALHTVDTARLLDAAETVAGLSAAAVHASPEAFDPAVVRTPGETAVAARVRAVLPAGPGRRVQDSYAFRALPQVGGAARDAWTALDDLLAELIPGAAENPLVHGDRMLHHGGFHTARLAAALHTVCDTLTEAAALSAARLSALCDPRVTGLHPFLAGAADGSSGVMILEYTAQSALGSLRSRTRAPGTAVLSLGTEEHASFAPQAADRLDAACRDASAVVACELVAAVRALRLTGRPVGLPLPDDVADRPLDGDVDAALALLPSLPRIALP
jgi:histidine ammonia-lyase